VAARLLRLWVRISSGGMDGSLVNFVFCTGRSLCSDHWSRGILPRVVCRSVVVKTRYCGGSGHQQTVALDINRLSLWTSTGCRSGHQQAVALDINGLSLWTSTGCRSGHQKTVALDINGLSLWTSTGCRSGHQRAVALDINRLSL